jgi:hypothetical protein
MKDIGIRKGMTYHHYALACGKRVSKFMASLGASYSDN